VVVAGEWKRATEEHGELGGAQQAEEHDQELRSTVDLLPKILKTNTISCGASRSGPMTPCPGARGGGGVVLGYVLK
jgi:hypothetical protein